MKHLNPRQGITIDPDAPRNDSAAALSVKHLNPRQGITIFPNAANPLTVELDVCETPKSPPGDYNRRFLEPHCRGSRRGV